MFGLNRAEVIGRLGADVIVNHLTSGSRVANMSIGTDESYIDRNSGKREERTEWHRVVTFQPGLMDMLEKFLHVSLIRVRRQNLSDRKGLDLRE
ncbi:single-stranded DNA-binding protein [Candidatus Rariloculus sp.]|uniref:single-stranded DNA-binding protein n=1 Tax=Candidatus Rariloculus sp. TaxID=3101265 RepID=UPI003D0DF209